MNIYSYNLPSVNIFLSVQEEFQGHLAYLLSSGNTFLVYCREFRRYLIYFFRSRDHTNALSSVNK